MLQYDEVGPRGGQDFEASREGGIHEAPLSFNDDMCRLFLFPGAEYCVLYLACGQSR